MFHLYYSPVSHHCLGFLRLCIINCVLEVRTVAHEYCGVSPAWQCCDSHDVFSVDPGHCPVTLPAFPVTSLYNFSLGSGCKSGSMIHSACCGYLRLSLALTVSVMYGTNACDITIYLAA